MPRMTPLAPDKNDETYLRNSAREFGHTEYGSTVPFFFTRYGAGVDMVGQYHGATCFLVSNGPSLLKMDLEKFKEPGVMIMSINNGASTLLQNGIVPDFWTCVDQPSRFVRQIWLNPRITKFIPTATFDKELWDNEEWKPLTASRNIKYPRNCPNVIGYRRNEKFAAHRFFTEASFNWGCHKKWGGCRTVLLPAIRIPYMLGFRKLCLVGVDLNMSETDKYHFEEGRTRGAIKNNNATYKRIINEYGPGIKKEADKIGYEIVNCNPNSALTCFPKQDFEKALDEALEPCRPTNKISTAGMYVEWSKKVGMTKEQALKSTGADK
jgi:hypothetical protein